MSSKLSKQHPFGFTFKFGNRKKLLILVNNEGRGTAAMLFLVKKLLGGEWTVDEVKPQVQASPHIFKQSSQNITVEVGIHVLQGADNFSVHNFLGVIENHHRALDTASWLSGLFGSRQPWIFPLGQLLLCLQVITIILALITSYDLGKEGFILWSELLKLTADTGMRNMGTDLAVMQHMPSFSVRMFWHIPKQISNSSQSSQMLRHRF